MIQFKARGHYVAGRCRLVKLKLSSTMELSILCPIHRTGSFRSYVLSGCSWTCAFSLLCTYCFQVGKASLVFAGCCCGLWLTLLQGVISHERWWQFSIREVHLPSTKIYKRTGNNAFQEVPISSSLLDCQEKLTLFISCLLENDQKTRI